MKPLPDTRLPDPHRIRVLLLTDEMEVGGTQRQIVHIARQLDRRRFEPTVLYFRNPSVFVDELEAAGVPAVQIEKRSRLDLHFLGGLVRELGAGCYDVMHCFSFSGELWGALARRLVPAQRRPVLLSSVRGTYEWYSPLQWRLKRWVSGESRRIIANSAAGADYARARMGLPEGAIELVYNGVAAPPPCGPQARSRVRESLGVGPATPLALFVGRLVEHKNLPTLLQAMRLLPEAGPGLQLAIAGDGPLRAALAQEIEALGLEGRVRLLGERNDVPDLMAAANFLVLPSFREGLSNVILEAMMAGLPVIASRRGGNLELVEHDRTGLLFDAPDAQALADAMTELASEPSLRLRLAAAARARVQEHHSVAAMVRAFERHYAAAFAERPAPAVRLASTAG